MEGTEDTVGIKSEGQGGEADDRDVTELSDVALVVAITRRNGDALAEAYRRHGSQVYGLARRLCGESRAEEVLQQVFLEMWERPDRYNADRGSLKAFLLTQAYGRSVDHLRSDGACRTREMACLAAQPTAVAGVENTVMAQLAGDRVGQLLRVLPDDQRAAIVLAYFNGYTYRQVAVLLGQPEGTIKSRIRAGLTRLRLALSDEGYESSGCLVIGDDFVTHAPGGTSTTSTPTGTSSASTRPTSGTRTTSSSSSASSRRR